MENKGYFIDEAENPGGNDWDMKNLFFILLCSGIGTGQNHPLCG